MRHGLHLFVVVVLAIGLGGGCSGGVPEANAFAGDATAQDDTATALDSAPADSAPADSATTPDSGAVSDIAANAPSCHVALACLLKQKLWKPGQPVPKTGDCMAGVEDDQAMEIDALLGCVKTTCKSEFDAFYDGTEAQLPALYGCMIERCSQSLSECVGGEGKANCLESLQCMQKCSPLDEACTLPCLKNSTPYQSKKLGGVLACIFKDCTLSGLATCGVLQSCGAQCVLGG